MKPKTIQTCLNEKNVFLEFDIFKTNKLYNCPQYPKIKWETQKTIKTTE
jgi:hypothetical protein